MGLDFTALIHYGGMTASVTQAISELEDGRDGPALKGVVECGRRLGYSFADYAGETARWFPRDDWERTLLPRPELPTLSASLDLTSTFELTFGRDAILVWHSVRWLLFLKEEQWHPVMLSSVDWFCDLFHASDCIITNDGHPAVEAFWEGATFSDALASAARQGDGEVETLKEMYIDEGIAEDLVFEQPDGSYAGIPVWDTKGYWRPARWKARPT
jgi:hypothetical protein